MHTVPPACRLGLCRWLCKRMSDVSRRPPHITERQRSSTDMWYNTRLGPLLCQTMWSTQPPLCQNLLFSCVDRADPHVNTHTQIHTHSPTETEGCLCWSTTCSWPLSICHPYFFCPLLSCYWLVSVCVCVCDWFGCHVSSWLCVCVGGCVWPVWLPCQHRLAFSFCSSPPALPSPACYIYWLYDESASRPLPCVQTSSTSNSALFIRLIWAAATVSPPPPAMPSPHPGQSAQDPLHLIGK